MANLPENTGYQKNAESILGSSSEDLLKRVSEIISQASATRSRGFKLAPPASLRPPSISSDQNISAGVGQPFSPAEPGSRSAVSQYNTDASSRGLSGMEFAQPSQIFPTLVPPSERSQIVTAPSVVEDGGQYLAEEGSPGSYLKNERSLITPQMKKLMLNGLSPRNFEVDHMFPIWAGGADTLENVMVMPKAEHAKKTSIQAIPYTLFYYSQLLQRDPSTLFPDEQAALAGMSQETRDHLKSNPYTLQTARGDVMGWESKSSTNIPDLDDYGKVDPDTALDIYKSWSEVPKTGIKDWLKEIPAAMNKVGGAIGQTAEEVFSAIPIIGPAAMGALKGLAGGTSLGWAQAASPDFFETDYKAARERVAEKIGGKPIQYGEQIETIERYAESFGELIGSAIGSAAAFTKISEKLFGIAGASGVKGMNILSRTTNVGAKGMKIVSRTLNRIGVGAKTAKEATEAVATTSKIGKEAVSAAKGAGPVVAEMLPTLSAGIKNGKILISTGVPKVARSTKILHLMKNIGAMEVMGQISVPEEGQDFFSLEGRGKRAVYDALYGGLIGYQKHSVRGYASVFRNSLMLSFVQGDDSKDALTNAATITAMHGIAHKQVRPQEKQMKLWADEIEKRGILAQEYVAHHKLWLQGFAPEPEGVREYVNEGTIPLTYTGLPKEVSARAQSEGAKFRARVFGKIDNMIDNQITLSADKKTFKAGWDDADIKKIHDEYNVVFGILDKSVMTKEVRKKADQDDLKQILSAMKTEEQNRDFAPSEVARQRLNEIGKDGFVNQRSKTKRASLTPEDSFELGPDTPVGTMVTTGYGFGISPLKSENYNSARQAQAQGRLAEKVLITLSPEQAPYIRKIQSGYTQEQLSSGEKYIDSYPEHIGVVNNVIRGEDGHWELFPRGFVASEHRVNGARMKMEELKGKPAPEWKTVEGDHLVTAMNENTKLGYEPINVFKDQVGEYAKKHDLKAFYAEVVTDRKTVSGEPIQILSLTPETWRNSIKDFAGTGSMKPQAAPFRTAIDAAVVKNQQEAKAAVGEVKKSMEIEPSSALLEKASPQVSDGLRVSQGVSEALGTSLKTAKSPQELIKLCADNGITLDDATATKWMSDPQNVTMNDAFVAVQKSGESGNPVSKILYENVILPYFKSPEAVATPGMKSILEAPLLGSKPTTGPAGETLLSSTDEANMYDVLGGPPGAPTETSLKPPKTTKEVRVTFDEEQPPRGEALKPPKLGKQKPSESPKTPLRAALRPPEVKVPTEVPKTAPETKKAENLLSSGVETPVAGKESQAVAEIKTPIQGKVKTPVEILKNPEEVVVQKQVEEMVAETGKTPLQKAEQETRNIPETDIIEVREQPGEFSIFEGGKLKGADRLIVEQRDRFQKGSEEWKQLQNARKVLSKDNITIRMKAHAEKFVDKDGVDVEKAFESFSKAFEGWMGGLKLESPFNVSRNRADLFHLFHSSIQSKPRKLLSIKLDKEQNAFSTIKPEVTAEKTSYLDDQVDRINKEFGSEMDTLYVEPPQDRKVNQEHIMNSFLENGYIPLGVTGNTRHSYFGVKFDKKLVERYDADPKRYTSPLDKQPLSTDADKFVRVFAVDALKLRPDTKSGDLLKRWKILNSHELVNAHRENGKVPTYRFLVAESPKFKDYGLLDEALAEGGMLSKEKGGKFFKKETEFSKAVAEINENRSLFDGAIFVTERTGRKILKANGMRGRQTDIKPTTVSELPEGLVLQKGNLFLLSKTEQAAFEKMFNVKLEDNVFLTFDDNIKIGKDILQTGASGMKEFEMPATSMRLEYHNPHRENSTFSSSISSKFTIEDGLTGPLKRLFEPQIEKWKSFVRDIKVAKTPEEIQGLFEKYPEYKITEENFHQKLQNAMKNGAGNRTLMPQLRSLATSILQKKVLSGDFIAGDHLKIRPDMGIIKDPKTGESRFLKSNEIALSRMKWESLGKPDVVTYVRFPVTRKTAIVNAKVIVTDEVALGNSQVVVSHYDGSVRLEGDYDGDAITIFKRGGKDGVPEEILKAIETERSEKGDMILPPLSKFEARPITMETINADASSALLGGEEIGKTASIMRIVNDFLGANISVKVAPGGKKRQVTIFSGTKPIWTTKIKGKGEAQDLKAAWGDAEHFEAAILSQEAVDSLKSPALMERLTKSEMVDSSEYLLSKLFGTEDKEILNAIRAFQWKLQTPFMMSNREQPIEDMLTLQRKVKDFNKLKSDIESAGGEINSSGEIFSLVDGFEPLVGETTHILYKADQKAVSNVKKYAKSILVEGEKKVIPLSLKYSSAIRDDRTVAENLSSSGVKTPVAGKESQVQEEVNTLKAFIDFVNDQRLLGAINNKKIEAVNIILNKGYLYDPELNLKIFQYLEDAKTLKDARKLVLNEYERISPELSSDQREAISYWLLTAEEANFKNGVMNNNEYIRANRIAKEDQNFNEILKSYPLFKFEVKDYSQRRADQSAGEVWRFDEIFNEDASELAKVYYSTFENFKPPIWQEKKIQKDLGFEVSNLAEQLRGKAESLNEIQKESLEKIVSVIRTAQRKPADESIEDLTKLHEILKKLRKK